MTSVLYLHSNAEDYLADSLLHGLRTVLGEDVVDVPRRDSMYAVADQGRTYGRGFTLYGTLPEVDVFRAWPIDRALRGEFDVIVFADIWRYWGPWAQLRSRLYELRRKGVTLVALDGHDSELMYPHGPVYWKGMRPFPAPRAHGRIEFFKRELTPLTARVRYYGLLPPGLAARRLARSVRPIAFSIPEEKLATRRGAQDEAARDARGRPRGAGARPRHRDELRLLRRGRLHGRPARVALRHHHQARGLGLHAPL